jgi:hypothetical protein
LQTPVWCAAFLFAHIQAPMLSKTPWCNAACQLYRRSYKLRYSSVGKIIEALAAPGFHGYLVQLTEIHKTKGLKGANALVHHSKFLQLPGN